MPVDFLTNEQKEKYGKFSLEPNKLQLAQYFHLDKIDLEFIFKRRGEQNRFGFTLQITTVRFLGTFLLDLTQIPLNVQVFVSKQLFIKDISILKNYAQRKTTKREHAALIRKKYGYHEFLNSKWFFKLSQILYSQAWIKNERPSLIFDFATSWLIKNKVLLPGVSILTHLISKISKKATKKLWIELSKLITNKQKNMLDNLLNIPTGETRSIFDKLRKGPTSINGPSFNKAIDRYKKIKDLGIGNLILTIFL